MVFTVDTIDNMPEVYQEYLSANQILTTLRSTDDSSFTDEQKAQHQVELQAQETIVTNIVTRFNDLAASGDVNWEDFPDFPETLIRGRVQTETTTPAPVGDSSGDGVPEGPATSGTSTSSTSTSTSSTSTSTSSTSTSTSSTPPTGTKSLNCSEGSNTFALLQIDDSLGQNVSCALLEFLANPITNNGTVFITGGNLHGVTNCDTLGVSLSNNYGVTQEGSMFTLNGTNATDFLMDFNHSTSVNCNLHYRLNTNQVVSFPLTQQFQQRKSSAVFLSISQNAFSMSGPLTHMVIPSVQVGYLNAVGGITMLSVPAIPNTYVLSTQFFMAEHPSAGSVTSGVSSEILETASSENSFFQAWWVFSLVVLFLVAVVVFLVFALIFR